MIHRTASRKDQTKPGPSGGTGRYVKSYTYTVFRIRHGTARPAVGIADKAGRNVWVDATMYIHEHIGYGDAARRKKHLLHCIAHEIGHVMAGNGHPDQGSGPAPLPGTNHLERLMLSGGRKDLGRGTFILEPGTRLVKGEWDAAEAWMKAREEKRSQQGGGQ